MGLPHDQAILCDTKGVIYQGRMEGMNQWKSAHAVKTKARSLAEEALRVDPGLTVARHLAIDVFRARRSISRPSRSSGIALS